MQIELNQVNAILSIILIQHPGGKVRDEKTKGGRMAVVTVTQSPALNSLNVTFFAIARDDTYVKLGCYE